MSVQRLDQNPDRHLIQAVSTRSGAEDSRQAVTDTSFGAPAQHYALGFKMNHHYSSLLLYYSLIGHFRETVSMEKH